MGRGRHYVWWRRWADAAQVPLYASGWAARWAYSLGLQGRLGLGLRRHQGNAAGEGRGNERASKHLKDVHGAPCEEWVGPEL